MLPGFIIEELRKREQQRQQQPQPTVQVPVPVSRPEHNKQVELEDDGRGVIVIPLFD